MLIIVPFDWPGQAGRESMSKRVHFVSLGCPKNLVDSEVMLGQLVQRAHQIVSDPAQADVIVVNTCGFIESAKAESVDTILEMAAHKKTGRCQRLVVTGCLAQRYRDELAAELPQVDELLGTGEIMQIVEAVEQTRRTDHRSAQLMSVLYDPQSMPRLPLTPKHYAYVKIAEGCNRKCAFCAIPGFRGKQRSRTIASVIDEVNQLTQRGVKEVNLIAQDTPSYGSDLAARPDLTQLIQALGADTDVPWIRLFYLYPQGLTDPMLDAIAAEPRVVNYFDVPFQHASEAVLRRMKRPWRHALIGELVGKIRERMPDAVLRTTMLLGFPGEGDDDFRRVLDIVEALRFDRLGVFTYSKEEGTAAYALGPEVAAELMQERQDRLMALQQRISLARNRQLVGTTMTVLIDGPSPHYPSMIEARSRGHAPEVDGSVLLPEQPGLEGGSFVRARIVDAEPYDLIAELKQRPLAMVD